jgi:RNA polymerase sigma-70 factor (ECF subfamily)
MDDARASDAALMAATRDGDRDAFALLVDRYKERLVAYLGRLTGSPERAEDLAQEAFLRLWQSADRYAEQGRLQGLLYSIAVNLLRSEERRGNSIFLNIDLKSINITK